MIERVEILLLLIAAISIAVVAVRYWTERRLQSARDGGPDWQVLGEHPDGRPTVVAFSTPSCPSCHHAQAPAIDIAQKKLEPASVRVIRVDASERPEAARAFGIMTVPSTVVIGSEGRIVAINLGFASSTRLVEQLQHA